MGWTGWILRVALGATSHRKVGCLHLQLRVCRLLFGHFLPLGLLRRRRQPWRADTSLLAERMPRLGALPVHGVGLVRARIEDHTTLISHGHTLLCGPSGAPLALLDGCFLSGRRMASPEQIRLRDLLENFN